MSRSRIGTIDVTASGKHRVRHTLPGLGRVTTGTYDTAEEAETQREAQRVIVATEAEDDGVSLHDYGEKWLTKRDVGRLVSDPGSDWSRWKNHIKKDRLAKLPLRGIRRGHVRDWLQRVSSKVARQTALNCLNIVRGILNAALEDELIKVNPAAGMKLPREKRTEEVWTFATPAEQRALVLVADEPERWILAFAMGTGLRAGELVSLRIADVHVDAEHPHVVVRYGGAPKQPTKGGKIRHVPLFGLGLLGAKMWLAALPKWAKKNPLGLLFPRLRGAYRDHLHVFRWATWQEIQEAAGITRDFRWHDLRHTAGSSLVSGFWGRQWSLTEVRDFLGHESVTTTERYAHLSGTALQRAAEQTREALSGGVSGSISSGHKWPQRPAARSENPEGSRVAPPARIELATFGLGSPGNSHVVNWESGANGQFVANCEAYLRAVARGDEDGARILAATIGAMLVSDPTRAVALAEAVVTAAGRRDVKAG